MNQRRPRPAALDRLRLTVLALATAGALVRPAIVLAATAVSQPATAPTPWRAPLAALVRDPRRVAAIRIHHIPDDIESFVAFHPDALPDDDAVSPPADGGLTVRAARVTDPALVRAAVAALASEHVSSSARPSDARWRVTFLDARGRVLLSVVTDAFGTSGWTCGSTIDLHSGRLVAWLHGRIAEPSSKR